MNKIDVLKQLTVGERVAEQETQNLKDYFLKTYLWEQIINGDIDVIFGSKGSGKSALYNYLSNYSYDLIDKNAILTLAENPRGTAAFKDFNTNPPTTDFEYKSIWKLYFTLIIANKLFEFGYDDKDFKEVIEKLQDSDLIARKATFTSLIRMVRDYINRITIEPNFSINQHSGVVEKFGLKISLSEPSVKHADKGIVSVDQLLACLNESLKYNGNTAWVAIDRLDAVFQDNFELEAHALRTLFQVYIDLQEYDSIRLIIFLRDDIWGRIIEKGFREASHITKSDIIKWDQHNMFKLLLSRLEFNDQLLKYLDINKPSTLEERQFLFYKIFQKKFANKAEFNMEWLINKIKDGKEVATPRELIQIVNSAIKNEIKFQELGREDGDTFISLVSVVEGIRDASKTKLETLFAEYPQTKNFVNRLKGKKVRLKLDDLIEYWGCGKKEAKIIMGQLIRIGFFKNESDDENDPQLLIPFIYRPTLKMQNEFNI